MNSLLPLLDNQKVFDTVLAHLIKQGKPARGTRPLKLTNGIQNSDGCMYRAPDGCMCAVGVLIPDELYQPEFEGESVRKIMAMSEDLHTHFVDVDTNLLRDLQTVHDQASHWDDQGFNRRGLEKLFEFSKRYKLEFKMPEGVRV